MLGHTPELLQSIEEEEQTIILAVGSMINRSGHEDDDFRILTKEVRARVLEQDSMGLKVIIPELDPHQIFYLHLPESYKK